MVDASFVQYLIPPDYSLSYWVRSEEEEGFYSLFCFGKMEAEICLPIMSDLILITLIVVFPTIFTSFLIILVHMYYTYMYYTHIYTHTLQMYTASRPLSRDLTHLFVFLLLSRGS